MSSHCSKTLIAALAAALLLGAGCRSREPLLLLETSPPDAQVVVDGYVHPGASPHRITFKEPGRYLLQVSREGFKPVEMYVTLSSGDQVKQTVELVASGQLIAGDPPPEPPEPPLPPIPPVPDLPQIPGPSTFTLAVGTSPPGAAVVLREPGRPGGRHAGATPLSVQLQRGRTTEVTLSLDGYEEHRRLVIAPSGSDVVSLEVTLSRRATPKPPPGPIEPLPPPPPPIDTGRDGYLSVNTNPWTAVHIDGRSVGNTPIVRLPIAPGRHTVLLENRDLGVRRKKVITVRATEHIRIVERLD